MRILIDIDNTICIVKNRDFANAEPIQPVIDKINALHNIGTEIWMFTSRGQNSCKGDMELIAEKYEVLTTDWLRRHGVQYDKLIFGKPLADYYVDDGGMSVKDFLRSDIQELRGNSNSEILRFGDCVIKKASNAKFQYEWYSRFEDLGITGASVPKDRIITLDTLKMEHIDGEMICRQPNADQLATILRVVKQFSAVNQKENADFDKYIKHCMTCFDNAEYHAAVRQLEHSGRYISDNISFCHGDLTLDNIIQRGDELFIIDPNEKECSTWLMDLAKLRCSFDGLEAILGYVEKEDDFLKNTEAFDSAAEREFGCDMRVVRLLEISRFARILPYMRKAEKYSAEREIEGTVRRLCAELR